MAKVKILITIDEELQAKAKRIADNSHCGVSTLINALLNGLDDDAILAVTTEKKYDFHNRQ